jgi:hypothetical protein
MRALTAIAVVLAAGCATAPVVKAPLMSSHDAAAKLLSCPADELLVLVDDAGWMAAGCGQLTSGTQLPVAEKSERLTCAGLARFDVRMRRSWAKKTGIAFTEPVKGSCPDTVASANP